MKTKETNKEMWDKIGTGFFLIVLFPIWIVLFALYLLGDLAKDPDSWFKNNQKQNQ